MEVKGMNGRPFHLGGQNDAVYIISGEKAAVSNDYPRHDADCTCVALVLDLDEAKRLIGRSAMVDDLAMHVRRLAYLLKTYNPNSNLPDLAVDYLVKHGLSFGRSFRE